MELELKGTKKPATLPAFLYVFIVVLFIPFQVFRKRQYISK